MHLRAPKIQKFPGGACPQTPLDWAASQLGRLWRQPAALCPTNCFKLATPLHVSIDNNIIMVDLMSTKLYKWTKIAMLLSISCSTLIVQGVRLTSLAYSLIVNYLIVSTG